MERATEKSAKWRDWGLPEWNDALFEHFFGAQTDPAPISRLVVTADELKRAVGDSSSPPQEVLTCFRAVVRKALAESGRTLCEDGVLRESAPRREVGVGLPRYFAHLVVTCIAATGTADSEGETEFRKRLNDFLGRPVENPNYTLTKLPTLWTSLAAWLEKSSKEGGRYRTLVLDREPHLPIIGYSVHLAFPNHRDRRLLFEVLTTLSTVETPPVLTILEAISRRLIEFSPRFQREYESFRRLFFSGAAGLEVCPFWSAVCDVTQSRSTAPPSKGRERARLRVRLDTDYDGSFALSFFLNVPESPPPTGFSFEPAEEFGGRDFPWLVTGHDGEISPAELFLQGGSAGRMPGMSSAMDCVVSEGLLLFEEHDNGQRVLSVRRPRFGRLWALVRDTLLADLIHVLARRGAGVRSLVARWTGWTELSGFDAADIPPTWELPESLACLRVLEDTIEPLRVILRHGVQVGTTWLGRRECLPSVVSVGREADYSANLGVGPSTAIRLVAVSSGTADDTPEYEFPPPPTAPHDIEGRAIFNVSLRGGGSISKHVDFVLDVLGADYKQARSPAHWFVEGTSADIVDPITLDREITREAIVGSEVAAVLDLEGVWPEESEAGGSTPRESLVEILAALFQNRRGMGEGELCDWFRRVLSLPLQSCWPLLRAWTECGALDCFTFRGWRARHYFARPAHVTGFAKATGGFAAAVCGLVPRAVQRQVELAARNNGVSVVRRHSLSAHTPTILTLQADDWRSLESVARDSAIAPIRFLKPLSECIRSIHDIASRSTPLPANHVLVGYWDWLQGRLSSTPPEDDLRLEWYKREDAPDSFVVRRGAETVYHSRSKNWAMLVARHCRGDCPLSLPNRDGVSSVTSPGLYLPLGLSRWVAVASGVAAAPLQSHEGLQQAYRWPSVAQFEAALRLLGLGHNPSAAGLRASWIVSLLRATVPAGARLVPLPRDVEAKLRTLLGDSLVIERHVPDTLLPRIRAVLSSAGGSR